MSPVDFKKWGCPLSLVLTFSYDTMSPVDFKVMLCRPVKFNFYALDDLTKARSVKCIIMDIGTWHVPQEILSSEVK